MAKMPDGYHLLDNHYGVILADPPWTFITRSDAGKGRSPEQHYGCMDLLAIKQLKIGQLGLRDSVLMLWVTDPCLKQGLEVMEAWGFTYKTVGLYWTKLNKSWTPTVTGHTKDGKPKYGGGDDFTKDDFFTGMGYWTRANPEMCLLGTRGRPQRVNKDVRKLLIAPRREHSRKPDETHGRIERLVPGPYLELFARAERPGWDTWGNEVGKFVNHIDTTE